MFSMFCPSNFWRSLSGENIASIDLSGFCADELCSGIAKDRV
ncbi:hypothetical protein [Chamaesiphon sp. GL140_3_metabinner_50]|nr:hypothetical protein [Chamaesiphon sp. GL140_3_metabinner_50]